MYLSGIYLFSLAKQFASFCPVDEMWGMLVFLVANASCPSPILHWFSYTYISYTRICCLVICLISCCFFLPSWPFHPDSDLTICIIHIIIQSLTPTSGMCYITNRVNYVMLCIAASLLLVWNMGFCMMGFFFHVCSDLVIVIQVFLQMT